MNAQSAYLETQVMTASPPKLRLLLIEAALRLSRQTLRPCQEPRSEVTFLALARLRKIILELLTSVRGEDSGIGRNIQSAYMYVFRVITEAQLSGDGRNMSEVVRILEVERETWQLLADRFIAEAPARPAPQPHSVGALTPPAPVARVPAALDGRTDASRPDRCFSLEA